MVPMFPQLTSFATTTVRTVPELQRISGVQMAERIRAGEISSREAVAHHVEAILRVNPRINAVVEGRFEAALAEADAADARLARDPEGCREPFFGVPCTIKESFALAGMPQSAGLVARAGLRAERDATAVARLREAGAIPLGVTNVSELCMWMESDNRVYGRTKNPYDATRIAGGSSGGEGAIVGSGASPIGLGADIGGSIRMPAFFCGAFGHKPTGGLVPGTGQFPIAENQALRYLTTGPITRRAEDLHPFLRAIAGPDGHDEGCAAMPLGDPASVPIAGLPVVDVRGNGFARVSDDLLAAQARCAAHLGRAGARVRDAEEPLLARSFEIWSVMLREASETSFSELLGEGTPIALGRELGRLAAGRSPHTFAALALAALERIPLHRDRAAAERILVLGRELQARLEELIGDGVMLYPSYPSVAPRHGSPLLTPWRWTYTAIVNVMELPATQVPLGLDADGLPLGVQVVGRRGNDHVTIAVALELERAFGGWVPPP
jgi:fatty acid amide hydrolase 2